MANINNIRQDRWPIVVPENADTLLYAHTAGDAYVIAVYRNGTRSSARLYTPPSADEMRAEARRRLDSVRKATGDTVDQKPDARPRIRGTGGDRDPYYARDTETRISGFRLDQHGTIPIPTGATLLGMNSISNHDEVYYTVQLADGSMRSYVYNVKRATNAPFNTSTSGGR